MIDLIEAYKSQSPYEKTKKRMKEFQGDIVAYLNGKEIGTLQPLSTKYSELRPTRIGYNPHEVYLPRPMSVTFEMPRIVESDVACNLGSIPTLPFITSAGRGYGAVSNLCTEIEASPDSERNNNGDIASRYGVSVLENRGITVEPFQVRSIGSQAESIIRGVGGRVDVEGVLNNTLRESDEVSRQLQETLSEYINLPNTDYTRQLMQHQLQNTLTDLEMLDSKSATVEIQPNHPLDRIYITSTLKLDESQRSHETNGSSVAEKPQEDAQPSYIRIEGGKEVVDLIAAYNERYKPKPAIRKPKVRFRTIESPYGRPPEDPLAEHLRRASENIRQAVEREIWGSLGSIGEGEPIQPIEPTVYSEEFMKRMPLTHSRVMPFTYNMNTHREPIYSLGSRIVSYAEVQLPTTSCDFENLRGLLSTGQYMARANAVNKDAYVRMGRDGNLYDYNPNNLTATPFVDCGESRCNEWYLERPGELWFRMELVPEGDGRTRIVDLN